MKAMVETKHSPIPWIVGDNGTCIEKHGKLIASAWFPWKVDDTRLEGESWLDMRDRTEPDRERMVNEQQANAEFICRAVNSHYDLVEALRNLEVAANTVRQCYENKPEKFSHSLDLLRRRSVEARSIMAKAKGEQ